MTKTNDAPDIDYALTVMDCWARDAKHDGGPSKACELAAAAIRWQCTEITQLRGNLSMAEEGLAAAAQEIAGIRAAHAEDYAEGRAEIASLTTQRDHWLQIAREKDGEIERLRHELNSKRGSPPFPEAEAAGGGDNSPDVRAAPEPDEHLALRARCVALAGKHCISVADCRDWSYGALLAFQLACERLAVKSSPHTTEDDYQHWLSYSQKRGVPHEADLRLAYYAGADVGPPPKPSPQVQIQLCELCTARINAAQNALKSGEGL